MSLFLDSMRFAKSAGNFVVVGKSVKCTSPFFHVQSNVILEVNLLMNNDVISVSCRSSQRQYRCVQ